MEYFVGSLIVIVLFIVITFTFFKPYPWLLASYPFALVGVNSSIDNLFGGFELSTGENWTLIGVLDIQIFLLFMLFLLAEFLKGRPMAWASLFMVGGLLGFLFAFVVRYDYPIIYQLVFAYSYAKVFFVFFIFYLLIKRSLLLGFFGEDRRASYEYLFWFVLFLSFVPSVAFGLLSGQVRLSLPHLNQNVISNFLVLMLVPVFSLVRDFGFSVVRRGVIYSVVLLLILFSQSRTGLLLLLLLISCFEWRNISLPFKVLSVPFLLGAVVALVFSHDRFSDVLLSLYHGDFIQIDTLRSRLAIWSVNFEFLREGGFGGVGPGVIYLDSDYPLMLGERLGYRSILTSAHNDFIQVSLHFGVLLSVLFFAFVFYGYWSAGLLPLLLLIAVSSVNSNFETSRFAIGVGFSLAVFLVLKNKNFDGVAKIV